MERPPDRLGELLTPDGRAAPAYPIGSVDNTLRILLLLRDRSSLTLADVAAELGIVRSSAHRLMAMLSYYDFVRQSPGDRVFRPGPALIDVGLSAARALDLRILARPVLAGLAESTGMTAQLALPRGRHVLYAEGTESRGTVRAVLRTGDTLPAHVTGVGKALLAMLADDEIRRLYRDEPPEAVTECSLCTVETLLREIALVRERGYAVNRGESQPGVLAMGAAFPAMPAGTYAGISIAGPDAAFGEDWEPAAAQLLKQAVAELGKTISAYRV